MATRRNDKLNPFGNLTGLRRAVSDRKSTIQRQIVKYAQDGDRRPYPWRDPDRTPYEILIAEVVLKRTTATAANRVYTDILRSFPTVQQLDGASLDEVALALTPIGLQRQRARSLKRLATYLIEHEKSCIPNELERLLNIPGVGDYTARAVLSFAFKKPVAVVDSNVERILRRLFQAYLPERPGQYLFQVLADVLLSTKHHRAFNFGTLDLGALVCRSGVPLCNRCPLDHACDYYHSLGDNRDPATEDHAHPYLWVRRLRQTKRLSLKALAEKANVSKLTVIRIERGLTTPRSETIEKLSVALDRPSKQQDYVT